MFQTKRATSEAGVFQHNGSAIAYTLLRSRKRRRTVSLSLQAGQGLRVLAPMRITGREVTRILTRRAGWIVAQQEVIASQTALREKEFASHARFPFLGEEYEFIAAHGMNAGKSRKLLEKFYRAQAARILPKRLNDWAEKLGVRHAGLTIGNAKRLWGTCSAQNAIRINWRIVMAPMDVVDYLLVHELCHIAHKNHGMRFWRRVAEALPDFKHRQRALRALESGLLARFR